MSELKLLRLAFFYRAIALGAIALVAVAIAGCSSSTPVPGGGQGQGSNSSGEIQGSGENQGSGKARLAGEVETPEFDTAAFAEINPDPEIRVLDREADLKGEFDYYEEDRIPRDAINPVYSPAFVSPGDATLRPEELVMGLVINGDARAYPVGLMRIREMVNDEVGGTPVLVTW